LVCVAGASPLAILFSRVVLADRGTLGIEDSGNWTAGGELGRRNLANDANSTAIFVFHITATIPINAARKFFRTQGTEN
jgi:hypothetical protein